MNSQKCIKCNKTKDIKHFKGKGGDKKRLTCQPCVMLKSRYKITYNELQELLKKQNNKCAMCNSKFGDSKKTKFNIDHCHETLKVRGLLCMKCNCLLGMCDDNIKILLNAIEYLTKDKDK